METVERADVGDKMRPLGLEHLPNRLVSLFGMAVRLGIGHAFIEQPSVQFVQAFDPKAWGEEPLPDQPNLVLDLTFLPTGRWRAGPFMGAIGSSPMDGG